ncbi:MAG: 50S ribosomal protein L4 [Acidobacteriota bacterium]
MPTMVVRDRSNKPVGEVEVAGTVFERPVKRSLLHEAVLYRQADQRQGTHKTKGKGEVSGGGRKPWRQKGTGRARHGSNRSPIWRKGGTIFGPQPRDYSYAFGRKKHRHALQMALSAKRRDDQIIIVDSLAVETAKTQKVASLLSTLELDGRVLIYSAEDDELLARAARNLPGVKVVHGYGLSVRDLLLYDWLLTSKAGIERIDEALR